MRSVVTVALVALAFGAGYWLSRSHVAEPDYALVNGQIVRIDPNGARTPVGPPIMASNDDADDDNAAAPNTADAAVVPNTVAVAPVAPPAPPPPVHDVRPPDRVAAPALNLVPPPPPAAATSDKPPPGRITMLDTRPAAPTSPPPANYRIYQNRDLEGGDLDILKQVDLPRCVSACRGDARCRAYTFDKWNRYCFLKSEVGALRLNPRSVSGIPENQPAPAFAPAAIMVERYRGKAFSGAGYKTIKAQYDTCETACMNEQACVAFTFQKRDGLCHLFDTTDEYFPNGLADSGGKRQRP